MGASIAKNGFKVAQTALALLANLDLNKPEWPQQATVKDGDAFDFIVVGSGSSGSVISSRLAEMRQHSVLLIEAGGNPRLESQIPSLFPLQEQSAQDWSFLSQNDGYAAQQHNDGKIFYTIGKLLGGSSELYHYLYTRPGKRDYDNLAKIANDSIWSWENVLPYYINKIEKVEDQKVLSSKDGELLGDSGMLRITRELDDSALPLLDSFREIGYDTPITFNQEINMGYSQPLFNIADGVRQGNARSYIKPVKDLPNFHVLKDTLVTKVTFDDNNRVTGIIALENFNTTLNIIARKEVIICAGAISSSLILLQSGIGPKTHLNEFKIPIVADLPVGENLKSHQAVFMNHKLQKKILPGTPKPLTQFPLAGVVGMAALNKSQGYADYESLDFIIPNDSPTALLYCLVVFGLKDEICEKAAILGREQLFTLHILLQPESSGSVKLQSTDPMKNLLEPIINHGFYSNDKDLDRHADYLMNHARMIDTKYFKEIDAKREEFDLQQCAELDRNTRAYWRCYALNMMCSTFDFGGTCSIGTVVDSNLRVNNVKGLRVVDASVIPSPLTANYNAHCTLMAEILADLMIKEYDREDD